MHPLRYLTFAIFLLSATLLSGQTAKRYLTVEHFTNTRCSSCAAQNPQLFTTLNNNPGQVHHLSIHSIVPYAACVFYQHNTVGNNTRRNVYAINSTPTTYTNGLIKGIGGPSLFPQSRVDDLKNSTSPIRIQVSESIVGNTVNINVKVKTFQAFNNTNLRMYVAIAEQQIQYNAPNGEPNHYNVFRTMLPSDAGQAFLPAAVGQELNQNYSVAIHPDWQASQLFATVFIQDTVTKEIWNSGTRFDLIIDATITGTDCANAANGSASLQVSGGTPPYTYQWTGGGAANSANGLVNGAYPVTVTDAANRVYIDTITIPVSSTLAAQLSYTPTTGTNGTATVVASGGTPPYSYLWSNGNTSTTANGLMEGYAGVTITDDNGCSRSDSVFVSRLTVTATVTDVQCSGGTDGSIKLSVSGGVAPYTYAWAGGATTDSIGGLMAGSYLVTVTDDSSNAFEGNFTVGSPAEISISITTTDAIGSGSNGSASALVTGGTGAYSFNWSNGATVTDVMQLASGTYTLTITDANACEKTATATVGQLTGIGQDPAAPAMRIYPNPISNSIHLESNLPLAGTTVTVINLLGEQVLLQTLADATYTATINTTTLPAGTYLVVLQHLNQQQVLRVVKY